MKREAAQAKVSALSGAARGKEFLLGKKKKKKKELL